MATEVVPSASPWKPRMYAAPSSAVSWARQLQTFGEDAQLTAELGAAYIRGFQGDALGTTSVATMTKHFPGGGPQQDGEDPHFAYGREQV